MVVSRVVIQWLTPGGQGCLGEGNLDKESPSLEIHSTLRQPVIKELATTHVGQL